MGGWAQRKSRLALLPALPMVAGTFYPLAMFTSNGNVAVGGQAGQCWMIPFYWPDTLALDSLNIEVTTAGAAGTLARLAIYQTAVEGEDASLGGLRDGGAMPGALLRDFGTLAIDSLGVKTFASLAYRIPQGLYWAALAHNGAANYRGHSLTFGLGGARELLVGEFDGGLFALALALPGPVESGLPAHALDMLGVNQAIHGTVTYPVIRAGVL